MKPYILVLIVAAALLGLNVTAAFAGPVTSGTGTVNMSFDFELGGESDTETASFPVSFPESAERTFAGNGRGTARVTYDLVDSADGAEFDVEVLNRNFGQPQAEAGTSEFRFTFTTDRAVRYTFLAAPSNTEGVRRFEAGVNDVRAEAEVREVVVDGAPVPEWRGNVPIIRDPETGEPLEWGQFTDEGILAAGTHTFFALAFSDVDAREGNGTGALGVARLTLAATDGTVIPLPPAAWPALGTIAAAGAFRLRRLLPGRRRNV